MVRMTHRAAQRRSVVLFVAFALLVAVLGAVGTVRLAVAANAIDTQREASIEVQSPEDMPEFKNMAIPTHGYCIATFDENGALVATSDFESWIAEELAAYVENRTDATAEALISEATTRAYLLLRNPDIQQTIENGTGVVEHLVPGLYLLLPQAASYEDSTYTFMPLLVPVPYELEGGELVYTRVPAVLKGSITPPDIPDVPDEQRGSVEIIKSLPLMDATLGNPTFVFRITATDEAGTTVYNNVKTLSFTEAGQKSVVIEGLPLGSTVTVTEVYSGASYTATTDVTQSVVISADNPKASVSFENKPNDDRKSGTGIENAFTKGPDGWKLVQRTAESEEAA